MDTISNWLTAQLQQHNLNALGLSYAIGVSHVTIGKWLKGIYTPNPANCIKLARAFNVPEDDVLIIAGHKTPRVSDDRNNDQLAEPHPTYHIGPRARLDRMLDQLTDDQLEILTTFLEAIK